MRARAGGPTLAGACARSGTARGVAARPGRELQRAASGVIRLAAFCDLRDELWLHVANSASDLLDLLQQFRVRDETADLRKRRLEPGKCWPVDLVIHLLPAVIWRDHEQVDLDVGLHAHQIRHPQEAGVDCCGVLHLEGGNDGITLQPEDVDQLNGLVGGIVELSRQLASKIRDVLEISSVVRPVPVVSRYPNVETQVGAELEAISQNKPWISILGNLFLDARHIS